MPLQWIIGGLLAIAAGFLAWQFAERGALPEPAALPAPAAGKSAPAATGLQHQEFRQRQAAERAALERRLAIAANPFLQLTVLPVDGPISSGFGNRVLISFSLPRFHSGVDVKAPVGAPVVAAAAGTVAAAGRNGTYGILVAIEHEHGLMTRYAHLSEALVAVGDVVKAGERIGSVGKTGKTTGANLHFEVLLDGEYQDPGELMPWPGGVPPRPQKPALDSYQIPKPAGQ